MFFFFVTFEEIRIFEGYFIGPVVKWYNAAFALQRREFDSRRVHNLLSEISLPYAFREEADNSGHWTDQKSMREHPSSKAY